METLGEMYDKRLQKRQHELYMCVNTTKYVWHGKTIKFCFKRWLGPVGCADSKLPSWPRTRRHQYAKMDLVKFAQQLIKLTRINQAMATLRRLLVKRCDLLSEHNRVHETLMNRLPVELKNVIFSFLLPTRDEWGRISPVERTGMLSFLAVCRGWRNIALLLVYYSH